VNPLHHTLTELVDTRSPTGQEGRICTAIAERLMSTWHLEGVVRVGNSLVVGLRTGRPLVSLYGHIDTVPEQGNGAARIDGDVMYGLGTTDMKAGLAVMMHLLEDPDVRNGPYDLVGVFYDKEEGPADENGLEEVLDRVPWLTSSALAVVMEPTANQLELGCNGAINADVVFRGKAAHSARPWLGENAITKAGPWLAELHARPPTAVILHGLEYREVFSVTRAVGGIANNVLPASFTANLNYRFPPIYTLEQAEARLRDVAGVADEVIIKDRAPAGTIPEGNPLLAALEAALETELAAKQGWTDVARLTTHGIPAVNYGPGVPDLAHQEGEHVPLANLDESFTKLKGFLTAG
jgi:succinyl-diaminopimelate desuccinylase